MVVGNGMLARAFAPSFDDNNAYCVFASGVSNSGCDDPAEFERERILLEKSLMDYSDVERFIYFGSCSVDDPEAKHSPYVEHKLRMEQLVMTHDGALVARLPQLAGSSRNPHTLLNFIFSKICGGSCFDVWEHAERNIIDIDDVVVVIAALVADSCFSESIVNVANAQNNTMVEIVQVMERVTGKLACWHLVDRGAGYCIDTSTIAPYLEQNGICFDEGYLERVLRKYYS